MPRGVPFPCQSYHQGSSCQPTSTHLTPQLPLLLPWPQVEAVAGCSGHPHSSAHQGWEHRLRHRQDLSIQVTTLLWWRCTSHHCGKRHCGNSSCTSSVSLLHSTIPFFRHKVQRPRRPQHLRKFHTRGRRSPPRWTRLTSTETTSTSTLKLRAQHQRHHRQLQARRQVLRDYWHHLPHHQPQQQRLLHQHRPLLWSPTWWQPLANLPHLLQTIPQLFQRQLVFEAERRTQGAARTPSDFQRTSGIRSCLLLHTCQEEARARKGERTTTGRCFHQTRSSRNHHQRSRSQLLLWHKASSDQAEEGHPLVGEEVVEEAGAAQVTQHRQVLIPTMVGTRSSLARFATVRSGTSTCCRTTSAHIRAKNRLSVASATNVSLEITIWRLTWGCTLVRSRTTAPTAIVSLFKLPTCVGTWECTLVKNRTSVTCATRPSPTRTSWRPTCSSTKAKSRSPATSVRASSGVATIWCITLAQCQGIRESASPSTTTTMTSTASQAQVPIRSVKIVNPNLDFRRKRFAHHCQVRILTANSKRSSTAGSSVPKHRRDSNSASCLPQRLRPPSRNRTTPSEFRLARQGLASHEIRNAFVRRPTTRRRAVMRTRRSCRRQTLTTMLTTTKTTMPERTSRPSRRTWADASRTWLTRMRRRTTSTTLTFQRRLTASAPRQPSHPPRTLRPSSQIPSWTRCRSLTSSETDVTSTTTTEAATPTTTTSTNLNDSGELNS